VTVSDIREQAGEMTDGTINLPAWGVVTLRAELAQ
jgi:hypothetical protein